MTHTNIMLSTSNFRYKKYKKKKKKKKKLNHFIEKKKFHRMAKVDYCVYIKSITR